MPSAASLHGYISASQQPPLPWCSTGMFSQGFGAQSTFATPLVSLCSLIPHRAENYAANYAHLAGALWLRSCFSNLKRAGKLSKNKNAIYHLEAKCAGQQDDISERQTGITHQTAWRWQGAGAGRVTDVHTGTQRGRHWSTLLPLHPRSALISGCHTGCSTFF